MKTMYLWYQLSVVLSALSCVRLVLANDASITGVTFRARTSFIAYHFNKTSSFPGITFRLEFSSTSCKGDLILVTSMDTDNFFKIVLDNEVKTTFHYKLGDGDFSVSAIVPANKSFCDGQRHIVRFERYGKTIKYGVDDGQEVQTNESGITIATFSKPDKIVLGGISSNKFDGCVYSASVLFYWKKHLSRNIKVNIIERYLKKDPRIWSDDVFVGACPDSTKVIYHKSQECTSSNTDISMSAEGGVIASPRLENSSHISRCSWRISAPFNHRLKFTLLFYNVSSFESCSNSKIVVFDGLSDSSNVLERFSCPKPSRALFTSGRHMMVEATLPMQKNYLDFIAVYDVVGIDAGPCPTNRKLSGKSGTIQSPNFPNNYEAEHDCSWIISVPRGNHVLLSFNRTDFHIHSCNKICDCDFLEVRAGTTAGGMLLGKFCGSDPPSPIYVNGSDMWLRFVSNKLSNNKGFRAKFEAIRPLKDKCPWNETFTAREGLILSPRFALDYPGNMECVWRIHVPEKSRVEFNFSTPIYFDPNCTDVIEIRDGLHENSPLLKRYCASSATPNGIVSTGREMFVRFKSDGYIRDHEVSMAGFNGSYYAVDIKSGGDSLKTCFYLSFIYFLIFSLACL